MRKAWFNLDPEVGVVRDEHGGTYRYPDTGKTLADDNPEDFWQAPLWVGWIFDVTAWLHGLACSLAWRWK